MFDLLSGGLLDSGKGSPVFNEVLPREKTAQTEGQDENDRKRADQMNAGDGSFIC